MQCLKRLAAYVVNAGDLQPHNPGNHMSKFADDTRLIVPACNANSCESELAHIDQWSVNNNLQLNRSKSTEIIFYTKHRQTGPPQNIPTLEGIPRVTKLNVLGVTLVDDLTFHALVSEVISSGTSSLYAIRKLKAHGMREELVQKVFQATVFSRIQYCSPAWWGFADSTDRAQLEAFVRKAKKAKFCPDDVLSFEYLSEAADKKLFKRIIAEPEGNWDDNMDHVLKHLLPPKKTQRAIELRPRGHNYEPPNKNKYLTINSNNLLTRILYSCG